MTVPTKPVEGQKTGTSGLRKKVLPALVDSLILPIQLHYHPFFLFPIMCRSRFSCKRIILLTGSRYASMPLFGFLIHRCSCIQGFLRCWKKIFIYLFLLLGIVQFLAPRGLQEWFAGFRRWWSLLQPWSLTGLNRTLWSYHLLHIFPELWI